MPMLVRIARVDEVPPGTSRRVAVRTESLFRRKTGKVELRNDGGTFSATDAKGGGAYRVLVRGDYVFVALDLDRESAPASLQATSRAPDEVAPRA